MTTFANQSAFSSPDSHARARGANLNPNQAITDPSGRVLAYVQTGGMLGPQRHELPEGTTLYRFGGNAAAQSIAKGAWWIERREFEKLFSFANSHELALGMAVRILCLVPPEWSDMARLVRARVARPLLAYRGLANSVMVGKSDGLGAVRLPHQNEIAARRLHQLFIPGLGDAGTGGSAIVVEQDWQLDPQSGRRGWLYV